MHSHCFRYNSRIRTTSGSVIICILQFDDFFWWIRIWGSESGFPSHPTAFRKFLLWYFDGRNGSAPPLVDPVMFLHFFGIVKRVRYAVWGVIRGSGTVVQIRASALAPVPWKGVVPHSSGLRAASTSKSAFRTVRYAAAFGELVKKLLDGRIRVQYSDPDLPELVCSHLGTAFAGRAMPTMEGTAQEDHYRTEVRV